MNPQDRVKPISTFQQLFCDYRKRLSATVGLIGAIQCLMFDATGLAHEAIPAEKLVDRWVYLAVNLQGEGEPEHALSILRRAKSAGYNGILLADYKFHVLDRVVDRYFKNIKTVRSLADELGLEIIPAVAPFGYSNGILAHNPNLAEELPVKELPMVAS